MELVIFVSSANDLEGTVVGWLQGFLDGVTTYEHMCVRLQLCWKIGGRMSRLASSGRTCSSHARSKTVGEDCGVCDHLCRLRCDEFPWHSESTAID